jgi:alpha-L-fucosidase
MINITNILGQEKYQATWESLSAYKTPDWFRDAKFGIFIHWVLNGIRAICILKERQNIPII